MALRLNGSTSGYVEIDAPAVAGDNTLTLPSTPNGSLVALDSSGRLLVGTSTALSGSGINANYNSSNALLQVVGNSSGTPRGATFALGRSQAASAIIANDFIGGLIFSDNASAEFAHIFCYADAAAGTGDHPSRLVFSTTSDGASSPTERLRIDSNGNIGVASGGNLGINGASPQSPLDVISNASSYGISLRGRSSDNVSQFRFVSNNHGSVYSLFESGPTYLATHVNGSERVRIDSSGRVLVGTSSDRSNVPGASVGVLIEGASGGSTNKRFVQHIFGSGDGSGPYLGLGKHRGTSIGGNTLVVNGDELGGIYFQGADGSNFIQGASIMSFVDGTPGTNDMPARLVFSTTSDGSPNPTVRMRIGSDGFVKIGTPVSPSGAASSTGFSFMEGSNFNWSTNGGNAYWNTSTDTYLNFRRNGTQVGNINWTSSATAFVTSSDYRMKENVVTLDGAIDRVKQLLPKRFNFIVAPDKTVDGFLAHEAQAVVPEAVTGIKDELEVWTVDDTLPEGVSVGDNKLDDNGNTIPKYQGIDQAKLVPLLTAALQEAIGRIETLEGMVAVNNITIDEQQHQLSTLAARLTALESA